MFGIAESLAVAKEAAAAVWAPKAEAEDPTLCQCLRRVLFHAEALWLSFHQCKCVQATCSSTQRLSHTEASSVGTSNKPSDI